jgi:uncharacterized protein
MFYCDTSALMKLYTKEESSKLMTDLCVDSAEIFVSSITWVEMRSAFALRVRTQQTTAAEAQSALEKLKFEWLQYQKIALDTTLFETAGHYTQDLSLRAYDSVQLACAQRLNISLGGQITFCCFDKQLNNAAKVLGMKVLDF